MSFDQLWAEAERLQAEVDALKQQNAALRAEKEVLGRRGEELMARVEKVEADLRDLAEDHNAYVDLIGGTLRSTAEALGKPVEGAGSSWHDIPQIVAALRTERDRLREGSAGTLNALRVSQKTLTTAMERLRALCPQCSDGSPCSDARCRIVNAHFRTVRALASGEAKESERAGSSNP